MANFTGLVSPLADTDEENVKSQLAYANALRKQSLDTGGQMVSGFYVPKSPWQNFIEGAAGGGVESYQREKQRGLEQSKLAQRQQFLGEMPQATAQQQLPQAGPMPDGGANPDLGAPQTVQRPAKEYAQDMRQWALRGMAIPGMEGAASVGLQQALQAPEEELKRQEVAEARQADILTKAREAQALQRERLDAQVRQDEQFRRTAAQQEKYLYAALAAQRQGGDNPHTQIAYSPDGKGYLVNMKTGQQTLLDNVGKAPNAGKTGIAGLPVKAQGEWSALQNLDSATKAYESLLKSYNPQSGDVLDMEKRAAIKGAFTDLQMRQKEAFQLGAITGPDMQVLEGAYTDPTGIWGTTKGAVTGNKPFEAQIDQGRAALNRTKRNFEQQYKVEIPEPAGTFQAPMPGAAPAGFKIISVRDK